MTFPTLWYMRPAKVQPACAYAQSDQSLCWLLEYSMNTIKATDNTWFRAFKLEKRLQRLVCVYTCQNAILLEITCHGSNNISKFTDRNEYMGVATAWLGAEDSPVSVWHVAGSNNDCQVHRCWLLCFPWCCWVYGKGIVNTKMSCDTWFPTMWHLDMNRLRKACAASC